MLFYMLLLHEKHIAWISDFWGSIGNIKTDNPWVKHEFNHNIHSHIDYIYMQWSSDSPQGECYNNIFRSGAVQLKQLFLELTWSSIAHDIGICPKWSRNLIEFSDVGEFRESDKSLKLELVSI